MPSTDLFGNPVEPLGYEQSATDQTPDYILEQNEVGEVEEANIPKRSFNGLVFILLTLVTVLAGQCFRLQITNGAQNQARAANNSIRIITTQPDRGLITDFTGQVLAQNNRQLALSINPETLPTSKIGRQLVYAQLEQKAQIDPAIITFIDTHRLGTLDATPDIFPIKTNLTQDQSLLYTEWFANTPGVVLQEVPLRQYATLPSLGQLIGYVGQANTNADIAAGLTPDQYIGKSGLEQQYNSELTGIPGKEEAEVNASGAVVRDLASSADQAPVAGETLKLSLDSNLQQIVASALSSAITQRDAVYPASANLGASAVVLDPSDGAIKAMVSLPDYDANLFAKGITQTEYQQLVNNPGDPLLNRTIQGLYPSGSTIKPLIAAAALEDGVIDPNRVINTGTSITIGQYTFPDWKLHPSSDMRHAIADSNDIYFYTVGGGWAADNVAGLGIDRLNQGLQAFGLGSKTGVDLPGEEAGLVPGPAWKQQHENTSWYIGDTYHQSIGQGYLLVTPLQMAMATAAIANGGTLYQPQLAWSLTNSSTGKETLLPHTVLNKNWVSSSDLQVVQQGMELSTEPGGTAQLLGKTGISSAGKTGTAQFGDGSMTHSWYIGYAPATNPTIAFAVLIEGDGDVSEATEGSEPAVEEILRGYFNDPLQPGQPLSTAALLPQNVAGGAAANATPSPTP